MGIARLGDRSVRKSAPIQPVTVRSKMMHSHLPHLGLSQVWFLAGGCRPAFVDHHLIAGLQSAAHDLDRRAVVDASGYLELAERLAVENPQAGGMVAVP